MFLRRFVCLIVKRAGDGAWKKQENGPFDSKKNFQVLALQQGQDVVYLISGDF